MALVDISDTSSRGCCVTGARERIRQWLPVRTATTKYKTKFRVKNWPACEAALRKRGDVTLWFDEDALAAWNGSPSDKTNDLDGVHFVDAQIGWVVSADCIILKTTNGGN